MLTKVYLVKGMVFPVVMYGCESSTVKKAECQRIDTFELWCWRRLLRVSWTARRPNQSILQEINSEYSLERKREQGCPWLNCAPPEMQCRRRIQSLGWDVPLEKEKGIHSSILGWITPWTEESGRLQPIGSHKVLEFQL